MFSIKDIFLVVKYFQKEHFQPHPRGITVGSKNSSIESIERVEINKIHLKFVFIGSLIKTLPHDVTYGNIQQTLIELLF